MCRQLHIKLLPSVPPHSSRVHSQPTTQQQNKTITCTHIDNLPVPIMSVAAHTLAKGSRLSPSPSRRWMAPCLAAIRAIRTICLTSARPIVPSTHFCPVVNC
eukprot:TRINITY_DN13811_c0_g1_i1.p2 TRINITY_DN13811_c0_g1~~TRINITY_DN13811_c0_g1_i1.p2  ORF type:complete len:102 (-),score=2.71 TRINITY_DN13811_c0_g1_i1:191-496(-)